MMKITDTVKHLLIINVIMFIGTVTVGGGELFYDLFALHFPKSDAFKPWQIVTHMFMHGGTTHLLFNMFALWMFGTPVEQRLGRNKFLFIYFSAGLGAMLFQLAYYYWDFIPAYNALVDSGVSETILNKAVNFNAFDNNGYFNKGLFDNQLNTLLLENNINPNVSSPVLNVFYNTNFIAHSTMVGASGCLMGILVAFGMMNPNAELMMIFLPIPVKAKYFIPGIIILDIISAITGQSFFSPSNTAYMAHVGGAVIGFLIMWYWKKNQFNKYRLFLLHLFF